MICFKKATYTLIILHRSWRKTHHPSSISISSSYDAIHSVLSGKLELKRSMDSFLFNVAVFASLRKVVTEAAAAMLNREILKGP